MKLNWDDAEIATCRNMFYSIKYECKAQGNEKKEQYNLFIMYRPLCT